MVDGKTYFNIEVVIGRNDSWEFDYVDGKGNFSQEKICNLTNVEIDIIESARKAHSHAQRILKDAYENSNS